MNKRSITYVVKAGDLLPDIPVVRVKLRSMPTNNQTVWLEIGSQAVAGYCYPLDIGDGVDELFVDNLNLLSFAFGSVNDKVALIYEVEK